MRKNMLLTFKSDINNEETGKDTIEFMTTADFVKKNNKYYITFSDPESFETNDTKTTLKVENEKITLLRFGDSNAQFIFEQGREYKSHYETPYGAFSMAVFSEHVSIDMDDGGGDLAVLYDIYLNGLKTQTNNLKINLKMPN